jgi:transposase
MARKRKTKKKVGRPSKLTPELREEIVDLIKTGNYIETVCAMVSINKTTFYKWLKKADESTRPNKYTKLRDDVEKAQAWSEARDVAIISKHSEKNWRAAAWKLERKYPTRWGKKKVKKSDEID